MKLVVIGHGMVAHKLLQQLVAEPHPALQITVLCEEPRPAYDRVRLSSFFEGRSAEELSLVEPGFFERPGLRLRLAVGALTIDRQHKQVLASDGESISYDKLVLATGSAPFVPAIPGNRREACLVYRTIEDLHALTAWAERSRSAVVIGGGLLGLECAKAIHGLGLETHVIEFAPRLMAVQVDEGGGRMLRRKIEDLGVVVHTGKQTVEILDGEDRRHRHRLRFADDSQLETDLIVFSAGIRPRDELARQSNLGVGERGGIQIDDHCLTRDRDVYAIGECALWNGRIFGLVAPGYAMARVAATHLLGLLGREQASRQFAGADTSTKLKLMGVEVASLGDAHGTTPGSRSYQFSDDARQVYKKLVVSADGSNLLGGVLVGDASAYADLLQIMRGVSALPTAPEWLILPPPQGAAASTPGMEALVDAAQICSCNDVDKRSLCEAVDAGAHSVGALKLATKAGTSCGGCLPLVTRIMQQRLKQRGVALDDHLCEHFAYSRQQLYHLIRTREIRRFDDLLASHGRGLGCDVCKPAVASMLASCWNDFILRPEHAVLQDSNDYFLANIQKDGSYSVVPRMPGGEVSPDGLIAVGQIAKRHGLYTKLTGGQRVDMFGARLEQLPAIWAELIDAGFESGHAYGKALRTVKSCVGTSWCRYGMQDAVATAIALEHRYKGLRSPHKLKFGVSGCARECAEAQSKDVGLIATEKGWNLFVCGNGGMRPRHAELLAGDLDDATVVRYIDRFLMFYVRTADRLQRTSVWRDHLEGGLDYLRQVVIEDRLGLAEAFEAQMRALVDSYQCEWKAALEDPLTRRRFRHFINSDAADDQLLFVPERGQIRPASVQERRAAPRRIPAHTQTE